MKLNKVIFLVLCLFLFTACSKQDNSEIIKYDTKMICKREFNEIIDDEKIKSTSNVYLDYDADELVVKAIYQSISEYTSINELTMYEEIVKLYNDLKGINAKFYVADDSLVLEIEYNYLDMDIDNINKKIGNMLEDDNILKQVDSLPISLDEFKKIELNDYECEVK